MADKPGAPREFETNPEWVHGIDIEPHWVWRGRTAVNPRFVAAVQPYGEDFAAIALAASPAFAVNAPYDDVVAWWLEAIGA